MSIRFNRNQFWIVRSLLVGILGWSSTCENSLAGSPVKAELIDCQMIWDKAPHCAFTDLVRWHDKWYCAFREGKGHAGDKGKLRVISSTDGQKWESVVALETEEYDLRDAALSVTPDDRLMVLGGTQNMISGVRTSGTFVSFSSDGVEFTEPELIPPHGRWLWRVTWHDGKAYGISYATPLRMPYSSLLVSENGRNYKELVAELLDESWPTEARLRFMEDGTAYCLHRRDRQPNTAYWGVASPPYTDWKWHDLGRYVGGPNFIQIPSGEWIGAGRLVDGQSHTEVFSIDPDKGTIESILRLPSGGDSSYPGLVWHDGKLWVSYYSSHEGSTKIYLARVNILPQS